MIIVEGPDGAGKTTLVKELLAEFPELVKGERAVSNRDELWKSTRQDLFYALRQALEPNAAPRIWDRLFWSELVYAPIQGREVQFSPRDREVFKKLFRALGVPVIFCLPSLETVRANVKQDRQMDGVVENIEVIHRAYRDHCPGTQLYSYDSRRGLEQRVLISKLIKTYLDRRIK